MFYYEFIATAMDENALSDRYEVITRCVCLSEELFVESCKKRFVFISQISRNRIHIGIISKDNKDVCASAEEYVRRLDIDISASEYSELTFEKIYRLLKMADRSDYIESFNEVLNRFNIGLMGDLVRTPAFEEEVLEDFCPEVALNNSRCFMSGRSLNEELKRIGEGKVMTSKRGHPVHYLLKTDDFGECEDIASILIGSLYQKNRLYSKRYTKFHIWPEFRIDTDSLRALYENSRGGTVVAYIETDGLREDRMLYCDMNVLVAMCSLLREYSNDVLTIFCLLKKNERSCRILYEELKHTNLVEIQDDKADCENAAEYLKLCAKEHKVRMDGKLFGKLEQGNFYNTGELNDMFDVWYSNKLRTVLFPQYKDVNSAMSRIVDKKAKGSAYDELMGMIGLDRAKSIIRKALDYNKAQTLFADRDIDLGRMSMHMIFTGNPGTAKTSVARLFARIMKDNGILSYGSFVECGRADIVGKYVGWTAPTVKKKFKEAEGGVLFIDEAYSLVDDRDGLYGDEAISTIVQEMENHRDDVIVIFAGYPDKMELFLRKNPGLRSRIAFHVPFEDYNVDELVAIADLIAGKQGMIISEEARNKLREVFSFAIKDKDFGNGRYVRNVIEKAKMSKASRLVAMDPGSVKNEDIKTLIASDIEMPVPVNEKRAFGFCG